MLAEEIRSRIDSLIGSDRVVLFMKGTRQMPQCGFSAATVGILDSLLPDYVTFNVLEDQSIREGIKEFSSWPTIPQLYIDREFVGGCDIVKQMFNSGDLHAALGLPEPDRTPPEIHMSDAAAALIRDAVEGHPGVSVHLQIDQRWQHGFQLGPAEGHEVRADANGIEILMDVATAQRARGLVIDVRESIEGRSLSIENPNAPPPVRQLEARELARRMEAGESIVLVDVRPPAERARAAIAGSRHLDDGGQALLADAPRDATIVFYCHTGQRSQSAAEHFRLQGFTDVSNLVGGIEAWSRDVDPSVPRY
ncbi:MAG: Grx4 family monothiol glutaredoxin [Ectothiorhodospiraceae bacterium]|nr:Grx4 family monothiol glutaredoxin [Ectothiorhodospiraceae bacterium]